MKMVCIVRNKMLMTTLISLSMVILPYCNTAQAAERNLQRPPFRNPSITGLIPAPSDASRPIPTPRPPRYEDLRKDPRKTPAAPDQGYSSSNGAHEGYPLSAQPSTYPQHFIFPPTSQSLAPSAPPVSEYGGNQEDEEEGNDSPSILSPSNEALLALEYELSTQTATVTLPDPKNLTRASRKTRFLRKLSELNLVSSRTVSASQKKDQAAQLAELTRKSLEARIPIDVEVEHTERKLAKLTLAMHEAHEKARIKQEAVAALVLSSSAPTERHIATSSPTISSPQPAPRNRSRSLSGAAKYRSAESLT